MYKFVKFSLIAVLSGSAMMVMPSAFSSEEEKDPVAQAIEYRQSVFEVIRWNFAPMGAMVKGKQPFDAAVFAKSAARVASLSSMLLEGFIEGSDKGNTEAKADIWKKWDDFKAGMTKFEEESAKLAEAAKSAKAVDEVKAQFLETAKTCKGCHENFKED
jgi:cytochrome c556